MFEPGSVPAPARPSFDRADTEPRPVSQAAPHEEVEAEPQADASARPTPSRLKAKSKIVPKKGFKSRPSSWRGADAQAPAASDKPQGAARKLVLIAISSAVLVALIVAGVLVLRPKAKIEKPAIEPRKHLPELTPIETPPSEEPADLAVKPPPSEAVVPPSKPAEPAAAGKGVREGREPSEKPVPPEKAEKPAASEKGKSTAAEPATEKHETKSKRASEADIQRANEAYQRANTKMFQGNTAEAIADFNQALKLNPADPSIHRGLGLAYAQSGKNAEAVKHLKLYLKASPKAADRAVIQKRIRELR